MDGITFDSQMEARRYRELKLLERGGVIHNLRRQVAFELQPGFRHKGRAILPIRYVADFVYIGADGREVVEDVKGHITKEYALKKKMMLYKGIEIKEAKA